MRPIHAFPVALAAAVIAGCGGGGGAGTTGGSGAPATTQQPAATGTTTAPAKGPDGAQVFASAGCGGCHTLKAAGSSGNAGPNLDDTRPTFDAVMAQVSNGGGGMPSFDGDLSPAEIDAVARYVSDSAGG